MLSEAKVFSSFSVKDSAAAKKFYSEVLGLEVADDAMGITLKLAGGQDVFVYTKDNHEPATFTVLNFAVDDINQAVNDLKAKGVEFEAYDFGGGAKTDDNHIMRGLEAGQGPDIAWFKDPAGNVMAVMQQE